MIRAFLAALFIAARQERGLVLLPHATACAIESGGAWIRPGSALGYQSFPGRESRKILTTVDKGKFPRPNVEKRSFLLIGNALDRLRPLTADSTKTASVLVQIHMRLHHRFDNG